LPEKEATPKPILLNTSPACPREGERVEELLGQLENNLGKWQHETNEIEEEIGRRKLQTDQLSISQ